MSDDPTKQVPPTPPTLETVLERINALDEKLSAEISELRNGQGQIITQLARLNAKIDILNDGLLEVKAEQRLQDKRVTELERKAS